LQYPNDGNRSIEINSYADPQLSSEAIQAQSANVDIVTGATDSSEAVKYPMSKDKGLLQPWETVGFFQAEVCLRFPKTPSKNWSSLLAVSVLPPSGAC